MSESLRVLALLASALLWAAVGVAWAAEAGILVRLRWNWRACPPLRRALAALAVALAVAYAGGKGEGVSSKVQGVSAEDSSSVVAVGGTEKEGNDHTYSLLFPPYSLPRDTSSLLLPPCSLSDEDISRDYRLVSVGTGEAFDFSPPAGACVAPNWALRGASADWIRLRPEGWAFPSGGEAATNLTVFAGGRVRFPSGRSLAPVAPVPLGLVPAANWGMLAARDRPSLFWHMVREDGALVLTWRNALLRRRTDCPVSFQAELRPTGGFTFRYDLSRLASDDLLEGVWGEVARSKEEGAGGEGVKSKEKVVSEEFSSSVVTTDGTQQDVAHDTYSLLLTPSYLSPPPPLRVTSLTFASADEMRCDVARTDFEAALGGLDPHSCPPGSTNTVWEHWVYTGTTNAPFARPQSTERTAVLRIAVSGSGRGELLVGDRAVPLVGRGGEGVNSKEQVVSAEDSSSVVAASGTEKENENIHTYSLLLTTSSLSHHSLLPTPSSLSLSLSVPRGADMPLYLRADGTLTVSLSSDDFAFGVLPDPAARRLVGRVNFPLVRATEPCIHDYAARRTRVELPVGEGAEDLSCTWRGGDGVEVENRPPRAATVTGNFPARETASVAYTLSHPDYLFGQGSYAQSARFCPKPPDPDPEEPDPPWYDGGGSGGGGHGEVRWCCHWGTCAGGCGSGCDCAAAGGGGPDPSDGDAFGEGCPEHSTPYADCAPLHAADYTNAVRNVPPLGGVLYLREPPLCERIRLDVPTERRNCCPCPDHWTNYVGVAYKSGLLRLVDADGRDFERTETLCDVLLSGVSPSAAVGDASVAFSRNGEICLRHDKTVLGVAIRGGSGVDLAACNALDADFGLPMSVCTNLWDAPSARLVTNVRLPDGQVHLELADATGAFAVWCFDNGTSEWRRLLDSATAPVRDLPMSRWKALMRRASGGDSPELPVRVTASVPGSVRLVLRYWNVIGGRFVQDEASQRITALAPRLRADIDHDGRLGGRDDDCRFAGSPFRFWFNEDTGKGDHAGQSGDLSPNAADLKVNGKLDLVNLFPVSVNATPFVRAWGGAAEVRLRADSGALRYCVLGGGLSPDSVRGLASSPVLAADGTPLESAELTPLGREGVPLGDLADEPQGPVLLAFEAAGPVGVHEGPEFVVSLGGAEVYRERLPVSIGSVDGMYRWVSLYGAESGSDIPVSFPESCAGLPDSELSDGCVFFLHGFNVSERDARAWNRAMFKRLWWAGSRARYCGVAWNGDAGLLTALSYHLNAYNAQMAAAALSRLVGSASGRKTVVAHSLGNMVACEAIREGMAVDGYFMLNAAVASEALDGGLQATEEAVGRYVPDVWKPYPKGAWCANWHALFPASDNRSRLRWRDAFAEVCDRTDVYNYYSSGDQVLEADSGIPTAFSGAINFRWPVSFSWSFPFLTVDRPYDLTLDRYAWQKQEVLKGVNPLVATLEAGWRFESDCTPEDALLRLRDGSIVTNAVFGHDVAAFHRPSSSDADVFRARAYNVPAISKPIGVVDLTNIRQNYDLNRGMRPNAWGRNHPIYERRWLHSDIKDMAYFYVYDVFERICEEAKAK